MAKLEAAAVIAVAGIAAYLLWKANKVLDIPGNISTFASEKYTQMEKSVERYFDTIVEKRETIIDRMEKGEIPGQPVTVTLPYMPSRKVETTSIPSFQFFLPKKYDHDFIKLGGWFPIPTKFSIYSREFDMPFVTTKDWSGSVGRASVRAPLDLKIIGAGTPYGAGSGAGSGTYQGSRQFPGEKVQLRETLKTGEKVYL